LRVRSHDDAGQPANHTANDQPDQNTHNTLLGPSTTIDHEMTRGTGWFPQARGF
jgi:hypothetical protein